MRLRKYNKCIIKLFRFSLFVLLFSVSFTNNIQAAVNNNEIDYIHDEHSVEDVRSLLESNFYNQIEVFNEDGTIEIVDILIDDDNSNNYNGRWIYSRPTR